MHENSEAAAYPKPGDLGKEADLYVAESKVIQSHFELRVFQLTEDLATEVFALTRSFPKEELYSLTDQVIRSSRSVAGAISEAWRRRKYPAVFLNKLNEAEAEAAETQTWLRFAMLCGYVEESRYLDMLQRYEQVLRVLVNMGLHHESWTRSAVRTKPPR